MQSTPRTNPSLPCTVKLHHHPRALRGEACGLCWAQSGRRRRCPSHTILRPDPALVRMQQHRDVAAEQRLLCSRSMRCTRVVRCRQNLLMRRLPLLLARHAAVMVTARRVVGHCAYHARCRAAAALAGSKPTRPHPAFCFAARKEEPPRCRLGSNPPLPLQHPDAACGG